MDENERRAKGLKEWLLPGVGELTGPPGGPPVGSPAPGGARGDKLKVSAYPVRLQPDVAAASAAPASAAPEEKADVEKGDDDDDDDITGWRGSGMDLTFSKEFVSPSSTPPATPQATPRGSLASHRGSLGPSQQAPQAQQAQDSNSTASAMDAATGLYSEPEGGKGSGSGGASVAGGHAVRGKEKGKGNTGAGVSGGKAGQERIERAPTRELRMRSEAEDQWGNAGDRDSEVSPPWRASFETAAKGDAEV